MDYEKLLSLCSELGYRLLESGGEIYRVEESVRYLLHAYGVETCDVFAIPSCLIVGLSAPGQKPITRVRRMPSHEIDIRRLESLNNLCRHLCAETPPLDDAWTRLNAVLCDQVQFAFPVQIFAYFLIGLAFCPFFGGGLGDALCSGGCTLAIGLCLHFMDRLGTNLFFKTIAGGFVAALLAVGLTVCGFGLHSDLIITGAIMALVPGIMITNVMRDIMAGDTLSGVIKLTESLLTGGGIALGTGLALTMTRVLWGVG
ncbi:MAG: threonine/serine exporter family protein [Intestinimonas sp.]|nr:threonine/serine exporter family protein [Intestinimonas sp.]